MTCKHRDDATAPQQPSRQAPPAEQEAMMGTIASAMPWVISLFFHAGVLVILAFITIVLLRPPTPIRATTAPPPSTRLLSDKPQKKLKLATAKSKLKSKLNKANKSDWTDRNKAIPMPKLGKKEKITIRGLIGPPVGTIKGIPNGGRGIFNTNTGPPGGGKPEDGPVGNARHIVYVVDCSGSMTETFNEVRMEMKKAVCRLGLRLDGQGERSKQSMQTFHIIFFSTGKIRENPPRRLVYATESNKRAAVKYLKTITPEKQTDPIPALKRAFAVLKAAPGAEGGKLIFLLTDGEFPDSKKVFGVINTLNAGRKIHINTILHRHHSPDAIKVLRRIAKENAGTFRFVEAE